MAENEPALGAEFPAASREQWLALVDRVLKGASFDKRLVSRTYDGIEIQPLYPPDRAAVPIPGRAPGAAWQIMARVDHPDPAMANQDALHELENGATGLALNFAGSFGAYGYGTDSSNEALARILDGVFLDGIALDLDLGWNTTDAPANIAMLAKTRGHDPGTLDLRMNFDPIGAFAYTGVSLVDWPTLGPRFAQTIREFVTAGFRGPFAAADGRIIHAAGGSEAQELAFTLASAVAYLRVFEDSGIPLDNARAMIAFRLAADADQFLTTAKFRALRKLWARVEEACGLLPRPAFVSAETAWRMMSRRDPWVNVLRATVATFAAVAGGTDAVCVLPFTAAIGLPDRAARRLARNSQLILLEEAHIAKVSDPAAGAGAIEELTSALCAKAWALFKQIESAGGIWPAIMSGKIQADVARVRAQRIEAVAHGREALTGTSMFPDLGEQHVAVADLPRRTIPAPGWTAAKAEPMTPYRLASPFEALRDLSDDYLRRNGIRPRIFLANLGAATDFTARATFAKNFFEAGGIEAIWNEATPSLDKLRTAFETSRATFACLCSSDSIYAETAVAAAAQLKAAKARHIYLAGRPGLLETELRTAGVQDFVYAGCDMLAVLGAAYDILSEGERSSP